MGWGARTVGSPFGQRTSALGVGDLDGDFVGVAVGVGEGSARRLGVGVGVASMTWRRPPPKTTAATTVVSTTASTPMITASRRFRVPLLADPPSAGGVETT